MTLKCPFHSQQLYVSLFKLNSIIKICSNLGNHGSTKYLSPRLIMNKFSIILHIKKELLCTKLIKSILAAVGTKAYNGYTIRTAKAYQHFILAN